jgi:hypothetical protein
VSFAALFLLSCENAPAEDKLETEARSAVLDLLADPISARFSGDRTRAYPDRGLVCGVLSARNATGRLIQDQRYYFQRDLGAAIDADTPDITFHHPSPIDSGPAAGPEETLAHLRALCEQGGDVPAENQLRPNAR